MGSVENYSRFLKHRIFDTISQVAEALGVRAFVIGGYVRDCILGRPCNDIDVVVEGSGIALAEAVAKRLRCRVSVFKRFGTAMIKSKGLEVEVVGARKESYRADSRKPIVEDGTLREDQERRDFTINAMSFSLQKENFGELVDPFDGLGDISRRLIRTPLDPDTTYSDDPLRMIRAIRFASQLSFEILPESFESIKRNRARLAILSIERINDELNKILLSPKPSVGLKLLDDATLLELILPQVTNLKGVETVEGRGHKDNFYHSLQVVDNVAELIRQRPVEQKENRAVEELWLLWAALLHDIGKPSTKRFEEGIGWTFHSHDFVGGKMIPGVFKHLKMPLNEKMKYVQKMVQLHLRPISLVDDQVTDSAVRRLLFDAGEDIDDLMLLCSADITSKNDKTVARHKKNFELVKQKMKEVEEKDEYRNFKNPITGDLVMEVYNIPPCNLIGEIKEYVKNAILDGVIENNYEAAYALMEQKAADMGLVKGGAPAATGEQSGDSPR